MNPKLDVLMPLISDAQLKKFIDFIITANLDFYIAPAAHKKDRHHCYNGGLSDHSISVARLAYAQAIHFSNMGYKIDIDLVVVGALLHDIGKVCSYEPNGEEYKYSQKGKLHHHIPIGYHLIAKYCESFNNYFNGGTLSQDFIDNLLHIIVSHHGRKEWSSNSEPQTPEALIVHLADMADAYVDKMAKKVSPADNSHTSIFGSDRSESK